MYTTVFIDWYRTLSTSQFWLHLEDPTHQYHSLLEPLRHTLFREQNWVFEDWLIGRLRSEQVMEILAQHTKIPYELIWHEFVSGFTHHKLVQCRSTSFECVPEEGWRIKIVMDAAA